MKVLLIDDHMVVREGVRRLLSTFPDVEIVEAVDGREAMTVVRKELPDVIILDLNLQDVGGLEVLRRLVADNSKVRVIVFSMHAEPHYAARALRLGAKGYVSKSAKADELATAVKRVCDGGRYVERDIAEQMVLSQMTGDDPLQQLSARELEILRLLGEGKSLTVIADMLGIAYKTVANTCTMMKTKLGLSRTADLIRLSVENRSA
ncbi:MAG: response regulator transcription factor [Hyphomicrobiaceae bacterium]